MKKLLCSIFFWKEPSQGAFFALTLLLLLSWSYFTAFCICLVCDCRLRWLDYPAAPYLQLSIIVFPAMYSLFLLFKEMVHWVKKTPHFWKRFALTLSVVTVLTVVATICELVYLPIVSAGELPEIIATVSVLNALVFCIPGFCFLFRPIVPPAKLLASIFAWIGSFLVFSTLLLMADPFEERLSTELHPIHWIGKDFPYVLLFCRWFNLNGSGCFWFALAGFLFVGTAYFLAGKILAQISGSSLRCLFQRKIRIQWYIMAGIYAVSLGFALVNTCQYHKAVHELEAHFNRPLKAAELGKLYYGEMKPDTVFWGKADSSVKRYQEEYITVAEKNEYDFTGPHLTAILPKDLYEKRKNGFLACVETAQIDKLFPSPLPPYRRPYEEENPFLMPFPEISICHSLALIEQRRCLYAMEAGDFKLVSQSFEHIDRLLEFLGRDPSRIGFSNWLSIGLFRNDLLAGLLETNLASSQWLEEQSKVLLHYEGEVRRREKDIIYSSTVECLDMFHRLIELDFGVTDIPEYVYALKYSSIRFLFPQGWWLAAKSAKDYARIMKVSTFSQEPKTATGSILVDMFGWSSGLRLQKNIASNRILRGLLAADLQKRQIGTYPDALTELSLDPFSSQPLKYRKGECKITRYHCKWNPDAPGWNDFLKEVENENEASEPKGCWEFVPQEETVNALQIWSVGPDGVDDRGLYEKAEYGSGKKDKDDIRSIILVREGQ